MSLSATSIPLKSFLTTALTAATACAVRAIFGVLGSSVSVGAANVACSASSAACSAAWFSLSRPSKNAIALSSLALSAFASSAYCIRGSSVVVSALGVTFGNSRAKASPAALGCSATVLAVVRAASRRARTLSMLLRIAAAVLGIPFSVGVNPALRASQWGPVAPTRGVVLSWRISPTVLSRCSAASRSS